MRPHDYALIDYGERRKLERFGEIWVDRPCPAAEQPPWLPRQQWPSERLTFHRRTSQRGEWVAERGVPDCWIASIGAQLFELRTTPSGQVGVFPEQAPNWRWLRQLITGHANPSPVRVLNLFAYTGGSTLAAASAGAAVTHVDAAHSVVAWARQNAQLGGLEAAPIRWIVDDARKFVSRELRRKNRYDLIVLDPPSYGHGKRGESWRIERDLPALLTECGRLLNSDALGLLITAHTPGYSPAGLHRLVVEHIDPTAWQWHAGPVELSDAEGRVLPSGIVVRGNHESAT